MRSFSRSLAGVISFSLFASASVSLAQALSPVQIRTEAPPTAIIVEGEREVEEGEVRDAVRDMAMRGRTNLRPMTRFQAPLCLQVAGLGKRYNAEVTARIHANTEEAGVAIADDGCDHNALVVVVKDPDAMLERLRKEQPGLFTAQANQTIKAAQQRGDVALNWSVARIAGVRGRPLPENGSFAGAGVAGAAPIASSAGQGAPTTSSGGVSRTKIPFSMERVFAVIVFDASRMPDIHLNQLADFATMKLLADPQPKVELESTEGEKRGKADTILTLFDAGARDAPQRMTQVDRAFLRGLYKMRPNDGGNRLEKFVLSAYEDIRKEDCATRARGVCRDTP